MQDALGPGTILGYCTNVHAGESFDQLKMNLQRYAVPVKQRVSPDAPMGVGLWFSAEAMQQVIAQGLTQPFKAWMHSNGLLPYTLNGFPFGGFHEPIVKQRVYSPHWADPSRYDYTLGLATLLADLVPDGAEGSISTLPLGWPTSFSDAGADDYDAQARRAAAQLMKLVHHLARIELNTGKHIHLCIEPEPGCLLETAEGVVHFFEQYLLGGPDDVSVLGYLRVCHDVCHSAVMFEEQAEALATYRDAGLVVGKAQLSSCVMADFDAMDAATADDARHRLSTFVEPRYLHQTSIRYDDGRIDSYVDLPEALAAQPEAVGQWRVHFHVPVFLDEIGPLQTTRHEIARYLDAVQPGDATHHFEVETYAWDVLPDELKTDDLADGIARELASVVENRRGRSVSA